MLSLSPPGSSPSTDRAAVSRNLPLRLPELPKLTPEEIRRMVALNRTSPAEFRAEEDARKAMEKGEEPKPPPPHAHTHKHGKK